MNTANPGAAPESLPGARPTVILQEMDDGAVLYCAESEVYFGLNPVGVHVWRFLADIGGSLDELARSIEVAFPDAPADTIRADMEAFVGELARSGLLDTRSAPRRTA